MQHEEHPDGPGPLVAERLRQLRAERSFSLDELAKRSGVSRAMLHQVENGRSVPTVATLWKIAAGLGVPFSTLMEETAKDGPAVLRHEQAKLLFNADQTFSTRALFPFDGARRSSEFYEVRIRPGGVETAEAHAPGTMEHVVLVHGEAVEIEVAGAVTVLRPHDALVFAADVPHVYRNRHHSQDALLYLVMTYRQ